MIGISGSYSGSVSWLAFVIWVRVFGFMVMCVFGSVAFSMIAEECSSVGTGLFVQQNSTWVVWIAKSVWNFSEFTTYLYMWFYGSLLAVSELQG